jgi:S-DNA-T family DNA segregation ATPase FtsK/SpoIIIE
MEVLMGKPFARGLTASNVPPAPGVWTRIAGAPAVVAGGALAAALASYRAGDPSFNTVSGGAAHNVMGAAGAVIADLALQGLGLAACIFPVLLIAAGIDRLLGARPPVAWSSRGVRLGAGLIATIFIATALAALPAPSAWPLASGIGGLIGDSLLGLISQWVAQTTAPHPRALVAAVIGVAGLVGALMSLRLIGGRGFGSAGVASGPAVKPKAAPARADDRLTAKRRQAPPLEPDFVAPSRPSEGEEAGPTLAIKAPKTSGRISSREARESQPTLPFGDMGGFRLPELAMLAKPKARAADFDEAVLRQNARQLEGVLAEFGVRGQIDNIRPGPVVTLYELVPAAGVKSARVVALSDDIARSMSVAACRVSVVPGRNAIGIELPNARRETVYLRDLLASPEYEKAGQALPLALGETIGGEPYIADLSRMPHLLIAGTTGSGKSVGVNAMILSILYRLPPEKCRFIMIDPKMLELSIYDGIPHLLAPVVTDPKKAIVALKWTVREMEDRYRRMSKIGVRNVAGYNDRANEALQKGEHFVRTVQTGFDSRGRPIFEEEKLRPEPMPYLVVVIDEVADLMMVAGKDIEGAVQRLAQMARAAGIHLIMATQRPSVDVITGTIKANFPTRISFQVTSKIDSRTIMGEQGAEQLLGFGDMLYMAGGGRITRLHGPFVSDGEVEAVTKYLREQGEPDYLDDVTTAPEEAEFSEGGEDGEPGNNLYDQAVAVVTRDRKASTSYIQRRLQIGYNRAASLMERMEQEGVVGAANHAGKREILAAPPPI